MSSYYKNEGRVCRCDKNPITQNHKEKTDKKAGYRSAWSSQILKGAQILEG
jgi:hypothetical protein